VDISILRRSAGVAIAILTMVDLTGCALIRHQFAEPSQDWSSRNGQLLYRNAKTTIIGEVVVRFSSAGNFELTFSKGPGVTLLLIRQDPNYVRLSGPLARGSWSGMPTQAPVRLRGWLTLRDKLLRSKDQQSVRHVVGAETFLFRF
jgi:hypothetical protein